MSTSAGKKIQYETLGDDAIMGASISRQAWHNVGNTGSNFIDGVISGVAWSGGSLTYAFPDKKSAYGYGQEKFHGFGEVSEKIKDAVRFALDTSYGNHANDGFALEGFTKLHITQGSQSNATLRYAESSYDNPTAKGYFPGTGERPGDVWIGPSHNHYGNATPGNYEFATMIHETGHALGLKHGHSPDFGQPVIPSQWDSLDYSVMTYRSYVNQPPTGYTNEKFGFPQTYMMADIAALQHMYGANFSVNSGSTVYSWRPSSGNTYVNGNVAIHPGGNRIFATIWDGGGKHDEYNLSAYSTNLYLDLRPGAYSIFKQSQLADLDVFSANKNHIAHGNIYNALQFRGDARSLIEDATGGSGNDFIVGNQGVNHLAGRGGGDRLNGGRGNDLYSGGAGNDTFIFSKNFDRDRIDHFDAGDKIDLRNFNLANFNAVLNHAHNDHGDVLLNFGNGDTLRIDHYTKGHLLANDFMI